MNDINGSNSAGKDKSKKILLPALLIVLLGVLTIGYFINKNQTLTPPTSETTSNNFDKKTSDSVTSDTPTTSTTDTKTEADNSNNTQQITGEQTFQTANECYLKAESEMGLKNYQSAISYYQSAIDKDPTVEKYYLRKSEAEFSANLKTEAIATVENGLKQLPESELLKNKLDILKTVVK